MTSNSWLICIILRQIFRCDYPDYEGCNSRWRWPGGSATFYGLNSWLLPTKWYCSSDSFRRHISRFECSRDYGWSRVDRLNFQKKEVEMVDFLLLSPDRVVESIKNEASSPSIMVLSTHRIRIDNCLYSQLFLSCFRFAVCQHEIHLIVTFKRRCVVDLVH